MTSFLLTETFDIKDYVLVFAGAQKLLANAGLTLVIIQDEFLKRHTGVNLPAMTDYRHHVEAKSLYATPPTFNCYLAFEMLQWLKQQGGIEAMTQLNLQKSKLLYDYIDESLFYHNDIPNNLRSRVNICFTLKDNALNHLF
jgi:phosphoserine aminotransferase